MAVAQYRALLLASRGAQWMAALPPGLDVTPSTVGRVGDDVARCRRSLTAGILVWLPTRQQDAAAGAKPVAAVAGPAHTRNRGNDGHRPD